jgi:myo-inositol-1(or 4)-monophosphatase
LPEPDLALLEAAARAAGEVALGYAGQPGEVREKPGGHGPVSEADLAVNRMLHARLLAARPDYGWLSEESEDRPARLDARRVFIVDPIDGTRAFLAGQRDWSHSLAVAEAGRVIAGVVHVPMLGATYAAARGGGARCNGVPIAASAADAADGARVLTTGGQLDPARWPGGVPRFHRGFRPSIALRLCLVADGEADAMLTFRETWEWDVAAGMLIAQEAGARVTDASGRSIGFNAPHPALPGIIAAGSALHSAILERLAPAA